jgi:hypothetical protein
MIFQSIVDETDVERRSYYNKDLPSFHRTVLLVPSLGLGFLQYFFTSGVETSFTPTSHGNKSKSSSPYKRTPVSTQLAKKEGVKSGEYYLINV